MTLRGDSVEPRRSIIEYAKAVKPRYKQATKRTKAIILNAFVANTGMHRKAAIRLLNKRESADKRNRIGRPRLYTIETEIALRKAWEATDCLCSKRLKPFLSELVEVLTRSGEMNISNQSREQLIMMSASTIDRILRRYPHNTGRRNFSTTKPGTLLKNSIPVRTFSDWNEKRPGFLEVDPFYRSWKIMLIAGVYTNVNPCSNITIITST